MVISNRGRSNLANLPYIIQLASCPSQSQPTNFSDEPKFRALAQYTGALRLVYIQGGGLAPSIRANLQGWSTAVAIPLFPYRLECGQLLVAVLKLVKLPIDSAHRE
jgi:hypothetical protein